MPALFGMLGLLMGLACSDSREGSRADDSAPQFVGFVTGIQPGGGKGILGRILVESHAHKLVHRHEVTVTNETLLFKQDDSGRVPVRFDVLEVRNWVQVWFAGPRMKSYPVRTTARQIVIVPRP